MTLTGTHPLGLKTKGERLRTIVIENQDNIKRLINKYERVVLDPLPKHN